MFILSQGLLPFSLEHSITASTDCIKEHLVNRINQLLKRAFSLYAMTSDQVFLEMFDKKKSVTVRHCNFKHWHTKYLK